MSKPFIWLDDWGGETSRSQDSTTSVERPKGCKGPEQQWLQISFSAGHTSRPEDQRRRDSAYQVGKTGFCTPFVLPKSSAQIPTNGQFPDLPLQLVSCNPQLGGPELPPSG